MYTENMYSILLTSPGELFELRFSAFIRGSLLFNHYNNFYNNNLFPHNVLECIHNEEQSLGTVQAAIQRQVIVVLGNTISSCRT